jgi:hypothetical protein
MPVVDMRPIMALAIMTSALSVSVVGCGSKKHAECGELVGVINRGIGALEKGQKQEKNDPSGTLELRAMADTADKTADEASKLELSLPETKGIATRYAQMAKDVAKAAREIADAAEKKDLDRIAKGRTALTAAVEKEDPIVQELNKLCAP